MNTYLFQPHGVLTFRQFKRKGWALFAALGREVRIGVLTAVTLLAATPCLQTTAASLVGVSDDGAEELSDTIPLSEATITASRAPIAAQQAARQVTTLTQNDVAAGVTSTADILKLAAAVDVRQRGGFGIQQDISIDGGTFDQTALLINGIPFSNPQTGHNAAQFPFSIADMERVEVIEGAASRLFGSGAFSGAINFVTRRDVQEGQAMLQVGSYGTVLASARQALTFGKHWHTSLSLGAQRSDGAVRNSDFKGAKLFWQGSYEDDFLSIDVQAGHVADDFGANTFYSPANPQQWEATRRTLVSLSAQTKGRLRFAPMLSWVRSTDHYQWMRNTHTAENFNRTDVYSIGFNAFGAWQLGRTAIGAQMTSENLLSRNLGNPMPEQQWVKIPGQDDLFYTRSAHRTQLDIFAEHNVLLDDWTISVGLLAQHNSALDHRFRLFPGIDVSYRPNETLRFFASWNQSLRLPTFTELWYKSPSQEGNVGLRPERNAQWRVGLEWKQKGFVLTAKAQLGHGRDMIDWVMYAPDDIYHAAAFRLNSFGLSFHGVADLQQVLGDRQPLRRLYASYAYLNQIRKDDSEVFRSNYAMNFLKHKFVVTLSHKLPWGINADWSLRLQHRAGGYQLFEDHKPTDRIKPFGTYTLLDLRLARTWKFLTFTCDFNNLTACRYVDISGVPQAGFLFMTGVQCKW